MKIVTLQNIKKYEGEINNSVSCIQLCVFKIIMTIQIWFDFCANVRQSLKCNFLISLHHLEKNRSSLALKLGQGSRGGGKGGEWRGRGIWRIIKKLDWKSTLLRQSIYIYIYIYITKITCSNQSLQT